MAMSSSHEIRRARKEDFDGVMACGEVYLGLDYLRYRYHIFQEDPNARPYVYLNQGEIVGYCCGFLVDDGMTLLIRASRVKQEYQGQGLYGKLTKRVYGDYRGTPNLKFEAFTTNDLNLGSKKNLSSSYTELSRKVLLNYRYNNEDLDFPSLETFDDVKVMTSEDMTSLLSSEEFKVLIPGGKLIVDWVPLRPLSANVKHVMNEREDMLILQSKNDSGHVSLVSMGTAVPCQLGLRYILDVFGSDEKTFKAHLVHHLTKLKKWKDVILQVVVDPHFKTTFDEIVTKFGISDMGFKMKMLYNFERSFT